MMTVLDLLNAELCRMHDLFSQSVDEDDVLSEISRMHDALFEMIKTGVDETLMKQINDIQKAVKDGTVK